MDIKVRAWDGKRWIYRGLHDRNWYTESKQGKLVKECHPRDKNMPIRVFTGKLDKNDAEIYEGGILKSGDDVIRVIWVTELASFGLTKSGWMHTHFFNEAIESRNCEIIGDDHTNPELVKS